MARSQYLTDFAKGYLALGTTNFIQVNNVWVANMCAQTLGGQRPLYYNSLVECMAEVLYYLEEDLEDFSAVELHCPKFGSGLAGGNWDFIQELILDCWVKEGLNVTVYSL